jgi:hypothetical protein
MTWLIFRLFIYTSILITIWYGSSFYIGKELIIELQKPSSEAIFVDQNITKNTFLYQNQTGSISFPFAKIEDALSDSINRNVHTIIIAPDVYEETLELPKNTILFAVSDEVTIIRKEINSHTIKTSDNTKIININISGANNTVLIPHNTSTTFINTTISQANDFGVKMERKQRKIQKVGEKIIPEYEIIEKTDEEIQQIPLVRFSNVIIKQNDNQGMYLQDGKVEIVNSQIISNGEEGIDLHPHMFVTISNTKSYLNGESGLESEIYDNIVIIENSTFTDNIKSGLAFLTSVGIGDITIKNTTCSTNLKYGMRCAVHKNRPESPKPFFQSVIHWKNNNNTFENNFVKNISNDCYLF